MATAPTIRKTIDQVPDLMTTAELSQVTGLSTNTLSIYRTQGKGPRYVKLGGFQVRYEKADVRDWIDSFKFRNTAQHPSNNPSGSKQRSSAPGPLRSVAPSTVVAG